MAISLEERIRKYLSAMPVAVSGQGGSVAALAVARALVWGFGLGEQEAMLYFGEWSAMCSPPWSEKELLHKLRSAEKRAPEDGKARGHLLKGAPQLNHGGRHNAGAAPAPVRKVERAEWARTNREKVLEFTAGCGAIDEGWFARRSPVAVEGVSSGAFLDALFGRGERVLVFERYYSQGDFLWVSSGSLTTEGTEDTKMEQSPPPGEPGPRPGGYRLGNERGVKAVASALPKGGRCGVWYLLQPVSGAWVKGEAMRDGVVKWTRRSEGNIAGWRHLLLESDEADFDELWMKVVASLQLPICAIYTSGGRSIHAIVRYAVETKAAWDEVKAKLEQVVCPLGADPGALSAVRLSRLPGCLREGKEEAIPGEGKRTKYVRFPKARLQRLLYLNPSPGWEAIAQMREVRG